MHPRCCLIGHLKGDDNLVDDYQVLVCERRYLNNIPVDVMRGLGVDTVIVVDVEDKDASVWRNLSAYDGGLSGWRLLWDRWCPIPNLRHTPPPLITACMRRCEFPPLYKTA